MKNYFIGQHPSIEKIRELVSLVSDSGLSVLLHGETGTGKEIVARLLHASSPRRKKRFVKVNCAALPLTLLESELFGYEKGAFTGADKDKPGKFELASEGVIFLDEIGDMPISLQAKLLHVLQSGEFTRLGGTRDIKVDTWVISSTNHDLEADIREGLFREDLYYRLNIIKIETPPLRERRSDMPLLLDHFIRKFENDYGIKSHFKLNGRLEKLFMAYHWPGNVRELHGSILRLLLGVDPELLMKEFLSSMKADNIPIPPEFSIPYTKTEQVMGSAKDNGILPLKEVKAEATRHIERQAINHALNLTGWNKREAARLLQISYKALYYKIRNYGIAKPGDLQKEESFA
ncbi:MAG: sigma-54-dependent Fis family transcriptional regulator [Deltaproteobacteria bacterium]|nr:sigma-54-dependent Fis family transcriptional regulator [Deltaproteobacteria bacterium]